MDNFTNVQIAILKFVQNYKTKWIVSWFARKGFSTIKNSEHFFCQSSYMLSQSCFFFLFV